MILPELTLPRLPWSEMSPEQKLATLPAHERKAWLLSQPFDIQRQIVGGAWWWRQRNKQKEPPGDWLVWIIGAGRGWGKNQTGAETLIDWVMRWPRDRNGHRTEWLVVAETLADVQKLNIEGPSGILNVLRRLGLHELTRTPRDSDKTTKGYTYNKAKLTITLYPDRQIIHCDSADNEDVGRGFNLAGMWLDELAKWGPMAHKAWYEGLLPALRTDIPGGNPRCIVTTTPKPIGLLKEWWARARAGDPSYVLTIGATYENASNLNPNTLRELIKELEGTRLGLQELHGHLLDEVEGALWTRDIIDRFRVRQLPPLARVVLGTDPAGTGQGDEMGLIVLGADARAEQYVIADLSKKLAGLAAARHAWRALIEYRRLLPDEHRSPVLVVEEDYGKKWLKDVLSVVYETMKSEGLFDEFDRPPIKFVKASELGGKRLRAEPVAMRYEIGRVHHLNVLPGLEDQMCTWDPEDKKAKSPDRVDGLVHGSLWLAQQEKKRSNAGTWADTQTLPVTRLTG